MSDIGLVLLARGLLGLAFAGICAFGSWTIIWPYVQGPALSGARFVGTLALVVGIPAGVAAAIIWRNAESPRRIQCVFALASIVVGVAAPYAVMQIKGVETYYGLFRGTVRLPVIDVSDALLTMAVASAVAVNVVSGLLAAYRMYRYREL